MDWYVASTHARQETRAVENLARQGYRTWFPRYRRTRRHARRFDDVLAPLFPGYVFVGWEPGRQSWRPIGGTYGIRRLICFGDAPAPLPRDFVDQLRARSGPGGLVHAHENALSPGMSVRVVSGPFADCVGRLIALDDRDRVSLLLSVLGGDTMALMPIAAIAPLA